jgi:polyphosphate kinase 2 (PPK2 family)
MPSLAATLRVPADGIDLASLDTRATPQATGGKSATKKRRAELADELADLQERLYAHGRTGDPRSVLLVLQGLDTAGKGGTIKHVVGQMDPQCGESTYPRTSSASDSSRVSTIPPSTGSTTPRTSRRGPWGDYLEAYNDALNRCSAEAAPWYVIPADRSGTATGRSPGC